MPTPEELRKIVVAALQESGLPRTLLAKDAELGRATLESWVAGLRNPSVESVEQLAAGLKSRARQLELLATRIENLIP